MVSRRRKEGGQRESEIGVVEGVEGRDGKWFWDKLEQKIGGGNEAIFWDGLWSGTSALKTSFPRLFQLSTRKDCRVGEMGRWEGGVWKWDFGWRRDLRNNEKEWEEELLSWLQGINLSEGTEDSWKWKGNKNGVYAVKDAHNLIERMRENKGMSEPNWELIDGGWRDFAPFKAKITAWRLLLDRLPTKDNLIKKNLLDSQRSSCSRCVGETEMARHVFVGCPEAAQLWCKMVGWIGVCWVQPNEIMPHREAFVNLLGRGKSVFRLGGL